MDAQQIELEIPGLPLQKNHQKLSVLIKNCRQKIIKNQLQKKLRPL